MKEIIYNITQQTEGRRVAITGVNEPVNKSNVLGIINKTQSKVLYTPLQYANLISSEWSSLDGGTLTLTLADNVQIINVGDKLFVKLYLDKDIDFSALAKEETLTQVASKVEEVGNKIDNIKLPEIDTTELAKESTLNAVSSKLDNLNVDVDLSSVAKQGENQEATNSKILEEVQKIPNLKNIYSARFEKNDDNINTYTMILPIIAGVEGDTIIL
jgi:hypothetical protein